MSDSYKSYKGSPSDFSTENLSDQKHAWIDYQVLGPTYGAISALLGTKDILPILINARGCSVNLRFTEYTWGPGFAVVASTSKHSKFSHQKMPPGLGIVDKPIPILEFNKTQVIMGDYTPSNKQLFTIHQLVRKNKINLAVILCGDNVLISGDLLDSLVFQMKNTLKIPVLELRISGITGTNPWVGYDRALGIIFDHVSLNNYPKKKKQGANLIGWKWPSRERKYDIGACLNLLQQLEVPVNYVLPGGASLADFTNSLKSKINIMWCSSFIGHSLQKLEEQFGIKIAGHQTPYGFEGTLQWIDEISLALHDKRITFRGRVLANKYKDDLILIKNRLQGKRVCVIGGPGRLIGLLNLLADFGINVVVVGLWWLHPETPMKLKNIFSRFPKEPELLLLSPSLYELDEIARDFKPDLWLGGFEEIHTCRKFGIPFVPTTVYLKSHMAFNGTIFLGHKMIMALNGHDFVVDPFFE